MAMSKLGIALRRRFKSPREALSALGIDQALLDIPRLGFAFDARNGRDGMPGGLNNEVDPGALLVELEKLLVENLSGGALERAREILDQHLGGGEYDGAASDEDDDEDNYDDDDDYDDDEEERRETRRNMMAKTADFLATKKGLDESEIAATLRDFPKNGLEHLGGALAEDLEHVMQDRRRRMARDTRKTRQAFDAMFPGAARVEEILYGVESERRSIAPDDRDRFYELWPEARRIGIA